MKIIFNIFLVFMFLIAFVPSFRKFMFWLLVGRQLVKEQKKTQKKEGEVRVENRSTDSKRPGFKGGEYVDYEEVK